MKHILRFLALGALDCLLGFHEYGPLSKPFMARREGNFHKSLLQSKTCYCCGKVKQVVIK